MSSDNHHLLNNAKSIITNLVVQTLPSTFPDLTEKDAEELRGDILSKLAPPVVKGAGDMTLGCFAFAKKIKGPPMKTAEVLGAKLNEVLAANAGGDVVSVKATGPYLNFHMSTAFIASVVPLILSGDYLRPVPTNDKDSRVMVEYSQPNTHKAFHVGHMRNAALGSCLALLYEQMGYTVVPVNYFGDEGAHVAKCLWYLKRYLAAHPDMKLDDVPVEKRGEWLGGMYSSAVEALDLASFTSLPYPQVIAAKVLKIDKHPAADAPPNWNVVELDIGSRHVTVVCGGRGYAVNDLVAYYPLGTKLKNKTVVEPKDMKGVMSEGIMLAEKELGIEEEKKEVKKEEKKEEKKKEPAPKKEKPAKDEQKDAAAKDEKKDNKKENKGKSADRDSPNNKIFVLPSNLTVGVEVTEAGRFPNIDVPADVKVADEASKRKAECRAMLQAMENGEKESCQLWNKTKQWSLDEFKRIYSWLNCRFDHDFFESEVSEESRQIVEQYRDKVFFDSNGALGADLSAYNLGFCMVLKSDGSGLYATKDLALAKRKFDEFKIDKSIYVVDAAQTLHFKQVFKCLELMGYEKAKQCYHLPYGQVVLPSGKMSSRTGTVIMFSQLKDQLNKDIYENFLAKYDPNHQETAPAAAPATDGFVKTVKNTEKWSHEEILHAQHLISVATIKYGMLNHDTAKDIVFVLSEWTAKSGNTGPYMLYAYTRIRSIIREVKVSESAKVDYSLLSHDSERATLTLLHEFWDVIEKCVELKNPSTLCQYLFDLSKSFSSWYEQCSVANEKNEDYKATRIAFITAIAHTLQVGLKLLGIQTLERM